MKNKYLFGGAIITVFMVIMIYLLTQSSIQYEENFQKIKVSDRSFKATGAWVREKDHNYDKEKKLFSFYMADAHGTELKVIYNGTMPNNFEAATSVVVTGRYQNGVFQAKDILTKCPSKYEGQFESEKMKSTNS